MFAALAVALPVAGCAAGGGLAERGPARRAALDRPAAPGTVDGDVDGDGRAHSVEAVRTRRDDGPAPAAWTSGSDSDPASGPRPPTAEHVAAAPHHGPTLGPAADIHAYPVPAQVPVAARPVTPAMPWLAETTDDGTSLGAGFAVPDMSSRGIGGSRLRAVVSVRAPDVVDGGLFYAVDRRLTIGFLGQRLEQERTSNVDGQLVDPGDPSSYVEGFSVRERTTSLSCGPFVQVTLCTEQGRRPEVALGAYALEWGTLTAADTDFSEPSLIVDPEGSSASTGDAADKYRCVYLSASKRLPWFEDASVVRGVRGYGGIGYGARVGERYTTAATGGGDPRIRMIREEITHETLVGWLGAEAALPHGFSLFGEAFTGDDCAFGYSFGLRLAGPIGITFTLAYTECVESMPARPIDLAYFPGGVGGQPSVFSGGSGLQGGSVGPPSVFDDEDPAPPRRAPRGAAGPAPAAPRTAPRSGP